MTSVLVSGFPLRQRRQFLPAAAPWSSSTTHDQGLPLVALSEAGLRQLFLQKLDSIKTGGFQAADCPCVTGELEVPSFSESLLSRLRCPAPLSFEFKSSQVPEKHRKVAIST